MRKNTVKVYFWGDKPDDLFLKTKSVIAQKTITGRYLPSGHRYRLILIHFDQTIAQNQPSVLIAGPQKLVLVIYDVPEMIKQATSKRDTRD